MSAPRRATSLGATGGLPGANAVPQASELSPDELDDTVNPGDVVTTPVDPSMGPDVDRVLYAQAADPDSPEAHGLDDPADEGDRP
jgi:hypothetical protein